MGIFLSISNTANELTKSQKLYRISESNEVIVDPVDFTAFIKTFRGLQCKKEDKQIELRNLVLEWKSRLRNDQNTQEIRAQAYELIDTIENLHDEQDMLLESENKKLEVMVKECAKDNKGSHRISGDISRIPLDPPGDVRRISGDTDRIPLDTESHVAKSSEDLGGTRRENLGDFSTLHKEISRRQQYLQMFNNQSMMALKRALLDIEVCRKMVDYSKDFVDNTSEPSEEEEASSSTDNEDHYPHPV